MKKIAYLFIAAGFLVGAYATSLDAKNVDWTLFIIAAVAAAIGVYIAKRQDSATARSDSVLETNRNELNDSIGNLVRDLGAMIEGKTATGDRLRDWIDNTLRTDLRRFADARRSMVHLFGLQTYADIMSNFAAGERYINRVWSASADGYDHEAEKYLGRAVGVFRDAQAQLVAAKS
ncbi:MAG: hypothetical protein V3S15_07725 [Woeseiaceae bacterium]